MISALINNIEGHHTLLEDVENRNLIISRIPNSNASLRSNVTSLNEPTYS